MKNPASNQHQKFNALVEGLLDDAALGPFILAWLQLPPNLAYLCGGLRRTAEILRNQSELISQCAPILGDAHQLADQIEKIAGNETSILKTLGQDAIAPIGRVQSEKGHPHSKYSLSVTHYWSCQFYELEWGDDSDRSQYDALFEQLAVYFWAITVGCSSEDYAIWIEKWRSANLVPNEPPPPVKDHASRLQRASYAFRLLSREKYKSLFLYLADLDRGPDFSSRVFAALSVGKDYWDEHAREAAGIAPDSVDSGDTRKQADQPLLWRRLNHIAALISQVDPNWVWPDDLTRRRFGTSKPGVTRRTSEGDGYVRLAETPWVIETILTDDGAAIEVYQTCERGPESIDDDPALDDYLDEPEIIGVSEPYNRAATSLSVRSIRARARARHMTKHYLLLPNTYALPTGQEKTRLVTGLKAVNETGTLHLIICGLLVLGRPIEQIAKIRVCTSLDRAKKPVEYLTDRRCWRLRVTGPELRNALQAEANAIFDYSKAMPVSEYIRLPDYAGFGQLLEKMDETIADGEVITNRLTIDLKGHVRTQINEWLGDDRIGLAAWHKLLHRELVAQANGDIAPATMLTGQAHAHGLTSLHYSHYSEQHLATLFKRASEQVLGGLFTESIEPAAADNRAAQYFGNPTHPKATAVSDLLSFYLEAMENADPYADPQLYNDLYVIYTLILLTLGQARRPAISPGFHAIDPLTLTSTWTEKARNEAQRRATYLPPLLKTHLERFTLHLNAMCALSDKYRTRVLAGHRFIICRPLDEEDVSREKRVFRVFRPKHFRVASESVFGLPLYSLRRFVRMALILDHQVSGEVVDAFMGHTRFGLSPFEQLATFPTSHLQELADGPLEQMLLATGARPVHSRLVAHV